MDLLWHSHASNRAQFLLPHESVHSKSHASQSYLTLLRFSQHCGTSSTNLRGLAYLIDGHAVWEECQTCVPQNTWWNPLRSWQEHCWSLFLCLAALWPLAILNTEVYSLINIWHTYICWLRKNLVWLVLMESSLIKSQTALDTVKVVCMHLFSLRKSAVLLRQVIGRVCKPPHLSERPSLTLPFTPHAPSALSSFV